MPRDISRHVSLVGRYLPTIGIDNPIRMKASLVWIVGSIHGRYANWLIQRKFLFTVYSGGILIIIIL